MAKKQIIGTKTFKHRETGQEIVVPVRDEEFVDPEDLREIARQLGLLEE